MPAPDAPAHRGGRPLLTALFWIGVGLSPIAAALLLIADSNALLRIAAVLALMSVALIGLSITLRSASIREELEATFFDEIDELHKALRNDIETAARATHRAFGEKLQAVQSQVDALRGQLDGARGRPAGDPHDHAFEPYGRGRDDTGHSWPSGPAGVVRPRSGQPELAGHPRERFDGRANERSVGAAAVPRSPGGGRADDGLDADAGWSGGWAGRRWADGRVDEPGREFRGGERWDGGWSPSNTSYWRHPGGSSGWGGSGGWGGPSDERWR